MSEEEEWKMMRGREKKDWKLWVSCRVSGSRCVEGKVQGTYKRLQRAAGKGLGKREARLDDKRWTCASEN